MPDALAASGMFFGLRRSKDAKSREPDAVSRLLQINHYTLKNDYWALRSFHAARFSSV